MINEEKLYFKTYSELSPSEVDAVLQIYSSSFLPVETKPVTTVMAMLKNDRNYRLFVCLKNSKVVGFSLLYIFDAFKVGLLDYMAVGSSEQGKGIGKAIFEYTFSSFQEIVKDSIGLILEVQKEQDAKDSSERKIREKRIEFYQKQGAKMILDNYLLPPQAGSVAEVTYLLIVPCRKISHIPGQLLLKIIEAIHVNVYMYNQKDLLKRLESSVPKRLRVYEIQEYLARSTK